MGSELRVTSVSSIFHLNHFLVLTMPLLESPKLHFLMYKMRQNTCLLILQGLERSGEKRCIINLKTGKDEQI